MLNSKVRDILQSLSAVWFFANGVAQGAESYPLVRVEAAKFSYEIPVQAAGGVTMIKRDVDLKYSFEIGRHEVTNALWNDCFNAGGCPKKAQIKSQESLKNPVARLTWHDAYAFSQWWSKKTGDAYRLPTEDEWMLAARTEIKAASSLIHYLDKSVQMLAPKVTQPIESFGANERGIYDLIGNVWEWTLTCWHASPRAWRLVTDPTELNDPDKCPIRVVVGNERAHLQDFISDTATGGCSGQVAPSNLGFRLVKEEIKK